MNRGKGVLTILAVTVVVVLAVHRHHPGSGTAGQPSAPLAGPAAAGTIPATAAAASGFPSVGASSPAASTSRAVLPSTASTGPWRAAATQFARVFARPTPGAASTRWWGEVKSMLTPGAAEAFAGTDPARVPYRRLTGPVVLLDSGYPVDVMAIARIPTDGGPWYVAMVRYLGKIHISWAGPDLQELSHGS